MAKSEHSSAFRAARNAAKLTQSEVAERSGTHREYIYRIERGAMTPSAMLAGLLLNSIDANEEVRNACVREWAGEWLKVLEGD